jgi:DNA-binding winged helix-turn-helix (wHTH) protein
MSRAPLTLLAVCPEAPAWCERLERLRAQGALVAHTADPARARQWLATLVPDLLLAPPETTELLRPVMPAGDSRALAWDGSLDSLDGLLQPWFPAPRGGPLRFGPLEVDEAHGRVRISQGLGGPREQAMPATELRLLLCLARQQGRALSREELLSQAWPPEGRPQPRSVDQVVRRLRQLLQPLGLAGRLRSLRGLGYRLDLDIPLAKSGSGLV